jgi:hypothetical protein
VRSVSYQQMRRHERSGEVAMAVLICAAIGYELLFDDLLSMATERWCRKHPVLTRIPIIAVAGHLSCLLPHQVDVFHAHNAFHRGIVYLWSKR